ncbi:THUMP domain-containing protein 1 [Galdieria sulphuraria]|uniref:THUMP domain-containing protein n=1 Tax=Galdieria sulphuraria TaxID=130081 RepID=M2XQM9_GALSU|nr:uncharacterized protein Gasu_64210 [Galdieria sulphuraria]EME25923.1 hypothetical protein Gasu_64210 [Galdieria sulphuraria]GJD10285.1 THUMP domain-containing protein 1 [Galdieria sulphuraria]|eukprot:XP_005702443.1 hypothetical protein Gasu_64210 [Galdieria sulphuraria]
MMKNGARVGSTNQCDSNNRKKRRVKFSSLRTKNAKESCVGRRGILVTCSPTQEAACRREAYQLLLEYLEIFLEKEPNNSVVNHALSLEDELEQLRKEPSKDISVKNVDLNLVYALDVGVKGSVFFAFQPSIVLDPCVLVYKIMQDVEMTKVRKCRYSVRFIPVDGVCYARKEEVSHLFREIAERKVNALAALEKNTFAVVFRKRNNSGVHRDEFIEAIAEQMPATFHVKLKNPDFSILVEVLKTSCLVTVVENYERYCKFNVHELWERLGR